MGSNQDDSTIVSDEKEASSGYGEGEAGGMPGLELSPEDKGSIRILVVDDEDTLCESCASVLDQEGYQARPVTRGVEAETLVRQGSHDIILLDLYMTGVSGEELLRQALEANPEAIVIVMTGKPSVESSIKALRAGAWDYIPKPFSATHMQVLVGRAAHTVLVSRESKDLRAEAGARASDGAKVALLGDSTLFQGVVELARRVASTDASVFISGESGTGKEVLAQYIHHNSRRSSRQMVALNCAALPETLLESEMFGHVKGAFTGAVRDKQGLMETANGGTLFLDEITEMSLATQAKLLRVVQDGIVRRVGSNSTDAVVNVRFVAATNRNPQSAVEEGKLREDLYYRLRVVPIRIPPLRERPEDIPVLAQHFLKQYWLKHREARLPMPTLGDEALAELGGRHWRGNVRELQNVMEHAVVLAQPGRPLAATDLPRFESAEADQYLSAPYHTLPGRLAGRDYHTARESVLASFERHYLTWVLQEAEGNMSEAARIAGVDRTTLYRLLGKHDLEKGQLLAE